MTGQQLLAVAIGAVLGTVLAMATRVGVTAAASAAQDMSVRRICLGSGSLWKVLRWGTVDVRIMKIPVSANVIALPRTPSRLLARRIRTDLAAFGGLCVLMLGALVGLFTSAELDRAAWFIGLVSGILSVLALPARAGARHEVGDIRAKLRDPRTETAAALMGLAAEWAWESRQPGPIDAPRSRSSYFLSMLRWEDLPDSWERRMGARGLYALTIALLDVHDEERALQVAAAIPDRGGAEIFRADALLCAAPAVWELRGGEQLPVPEGSLPSLLSALALLAEELPPSRGMDDSRAMVNLLAGWHAEALSAADAALADGDEPLTGHDRVLALCTRASSLRALGREDEARRDLAEARRLDPDCPRPARVQAFPWGGGPDVAPA